MPGLPVYIVSPRGLLSERFVARSYVLARMGQHEPSAIATRAALAVLHGVSSAHSSACAPAAVQAHLHMMGVAYNNLAVALANIVLDADLPAIRLLAQRAAATISAANQPGRLETIVQENAVLLQKQRSSIGMALARATPNEDCSWQPTSTR